MNIHPVFYSGLLIPYKEKEYPGRQVHTNPDPELINKEWEYTVENILDSRKRRNKYQYLIKWLDYPDIDNTWEPFGKGLTNSVKLIREFHINHLTVVKPPHLENWLTKRLEYSLLISKRILVKEQDTGDIVLQEEQMWKDWMKRKSESSEYFSILASDSSTKEIREGLEKLQLNNKPTIEN
ncbi:uncharacterized protein FOMMEDRAFT_100036 [Fomitiporia mediterranea MF3/22]|uniref:Chromo domain-containing protein n=1 Tax=Fomitiporia mediterranea (strain MF3/22) TaxID=694068 RepID=R7SF54_FOMME|nr:uncharacterized protein FOMMEDRAFT_100036 [Fomitiporia mediterranea MF3/22]EJC97333.1 hypothetical protein FOMMEDRAFT_100036 [Fomitiporia mediterranea MF3/22]